MKKRRRIIEKDGVRYAVMNETRDHFVAMRLTKSYQLDKRYETKLHNVERKACRTIGERLMDL